MDSRVGSKLSLERLAAGPRTGISQAEPVSRSYQFGGKMDISKILAELRLEREQLGEAILSLERLAAGGAKRRGRPPAWMAKIKDETITKRRPGRPLGSKNRTPSTFQS